MNANLKIISDLKNFIKLSATQPDLKELFTVSKNDFSRNRKLGFERLVLMLINFFRKSYSIEIADFYNLINGEETKVTKSAFCQQRMKIKDLFFACLNEILVESFYEHYAEQVKRWNGFRLIAIDGSIACLVNTGDVTSHFGTQGNHIKEMTMGQVLSAFDILNGITIRADMFPIKVAEQKLAQHWVSFYSSDMLLIYDRGYPGFANFFLHQNKEEPQAYLMRCPLGFSKEVKAFVNSVENDTISLFRANKYSSEELYKQGFIVPVGSTINVRLIKVVLDDGTMEVLATNLFNKKDYPHDVFKELYFTRWGIETKYDTIKNQLQLEAFSGQKVATIMQDFYITFFLSNLQEIIAKPCEKHLIRINRSRKHHYKINRNIAFGMMKNRIVEMFMIYNPEKILQNLEKLFLQHIEPVRTNRKYTHQRITAKARSKYQALTNYKRAI